MKRYFFMLVILAVILVACGNNNDDNGGLESVDDTGNTPRSSANQGSSASENVDSQTNLSIENNGLLSNIPPAELNVFEMPPVSDMSGEILFVQGNTRTSGYNEGDAGRIFYASFEGGEPEVVATRVFTTSVIMSPDKQKLAFIRANGIRWYLNILDIQTHEVTELIRLRSQFGNITGWSPDGEWLIVNVPVPVGTGQILVKLDGSESVELGSGVPFWTTDNRIVLMSLQIFQGTFDPPQVQDVQIYDPATDEWSPISINFDPTSLNIFGGIDLVSELNNQSIELAPNFAAFSQYGFGAMLFPERDDILMVQGTTPSESLSNVPPHCGNWEMAMYAPNGEQTSLFYEVTDTAYISDINYVDGYFYYQRWYFNGCELANSALQVALERQTIDGEVELITDQLYPGEDINLTFMRVNNGTKYSISPDGRYVLWIEGSYDERLTGLRLTDLETGETAELMTWQSDNPNAFLSFEAFTSVFWTP